MRCATSTLILKPDTKAELLKTYFLARAQGDQDTMQQVDHQLNLSKMYEAMWQKQQVAKRKIAQIKLRQMEVSFQSTDFGRRRKQVDQQLFSGAVD